MSREREAQRGAMQQQLVGTLESLVFSRRRRLGLASSALHLTQSATFFSNPTHKGFASLASIRCISPRSSRCLLMLSLIRLMVQLRQCDITINLQDSFNRRY